MRSTRFRLAPVALVVALLAPPVSAEVKVGQPAPPFSVFTLDWKKVALADLRGKVVVLNYWATWCAPCRSEIVVLNNYLVRHPGQDLNIFAVTMDSTWPNDGIRSVAKRLAFPLVSKLHGSGYGLIGGAIPTSYVIDRAGIVRHAAAGAFTDDSFTDLITPLLAEPAPPPPDLKGA